MGVNYRAVVAIGREFYDTGEAKDFIRNNMKLNEDDEELLSDSLGEFLETGVGGCLNLYTGEHWYVGFDISCRSPEAFEKSFNDGVKTWKEMFPDEEFEIINTVCVS